MVSGVAAERARRTKFPARSHCNRRGIARGVCVSDRTGEEVTGVIEFFSREIRKLEPELLDMFDSIGSQIGQFMQRRRAEMELKLYADYLEAARRAQEEDARRLAQLVKNWKSRRRAPKKERAPRANSWPT